MHKILVIYGHANCGKSETINFVRELIRQDGGESTASNVRAGDQNETFLYKGQIVCICPGGDTEDIVKRNFVYASAKNADVIITASRTRGGTVEEVLRWEKELGVKTDWMQKSYECNLSKSTQTSCNKEFAQVVFQRVFGK